MKCLEAVQPRHCEWRDKRRIIDYKSHSHSNRYSLLPFNVLLNVNVKTLLPSFLFFEAGVQVAIVLVKVSSKEEYMCIWFDNLEKRVPLIVFTVWYVILKHYYWTMLYHIWQFPLYVNQFVIIQLLRLLLYFLKYTHNIVRFECLSIQGLNYLNVKSRFTTKSYKYKCNIILRI